MNPAPAKNGCMGMFQDSAAGVLVFDGKFQVLEANKAACGMLGHAQKTLQRLSLEDLVAAGGRAEAQRRLRALKNGAESGGGLSLTLERRDGARLEVMAAAACQRDEAGGFQQGMLIFMDVSASSRAQAELAREVELNRVLLDHAPVCIGLLAPDGSVLRVNAAAEKLFGHKLENVAGRKVWSLPVVDEKETAATRLRIETLAKNGGTMTFTRPMHTRDKGTRLIEIGHTAVKKADGSVDFIVTTGVDTTERRRLESEVIRVAEQEHIRIGHDLHDGIGQTLTGIHSLVEALVQRLEGESQKDALRVQELVKTAIAETRRLSHGLSPASVKNRGLAGGLMLIAETVRENFRRQCACQIDEPAPKLGQEKEIHLFRIAQEAVNNAIRHGGATKMHISLRRKSSTQGVLEIRDNGHGFAAEKAAFPQEGIGLRVMEHRAHLIDGELKVKSLKNQGVRVLCHFPIGNA